MSTADDLLRWAYEQRKLLNNEGSIGWRHWKKWMEDTDAYLTRTHDQGADGTWTKRASLVADWEMWQIWADGENARCVADFLTEADADAIIAVHNAALTQPPAPSGETRGLIGGGL
jgi:hypothetical protein